jgi:hypothetical protein
VSEKPTVAAPDGEQSSTPPPESAGQR